MREDASPNLPCQNHPRLNEYRLKLKEPQTHRLRPPALQSCHPISNSTHWKKIVRVEKYVFMGLQDASCYTFQWSEDMLEWISCLTNFHHTWHIKCSTTQIKHKDRLMALFLKSVGKRSCCGFINNAEDLYRCNSTSIFCSSSLRVIEVCRDSYNSFVYLVIEKFGRIIN